MRECPKCGYIDPPYWRTRIFDSEVDFCHLSDFEKVEPALAAKLIPGIALQQGKYVYRMTKTKYVWRLWEPLFKTRGFTPHKYFDGKGSKKSASFKAWVRKPKVAKKFEQIRLRD